MSKEIEKIDKNGNVVKVFESAKDAALDAKTNKYTITNRTSGKIKSDYNGFYYKYTGVITEKVNFKYNINDEIKDEKGHIKILDKIFKEKIGKSYKYICLKCGYVGYISEYNLIKKKIRCSACCKNSKLIDKQYVNTISKTHPWVDKYLVDKEDSKKYTYGSDKKIKTKCPICGTYKYYRVNKLISRGFSCNFCGTGISYPNKLMEQILIYNKIEYEKEKKFDWSENKRYDFFIPSLNYIIEIDGKQHYYGMGNLKKIEDIHNNDVFKENIAIKNGITEYIHVNAMESNCSFIVNELKKIEKLSFLNLDLNFDEINKEIISNNSLYNLIIDLWNKGNTTTNIGKIVGLNKVTISKYLKNANSIGKVDYNAKRDKNRGTKKKVKDIENNIIYESILECSKKTGISRYSIKNSKKFEIC